MIAVPTLSPLVLSFTTLVGSAMMVRGWFGPKLAWSNPRVNTMWSPGPIDCSIGELKTNTFCVGMAAAKLHGPVTLVPVLATENRTAARAPAGITFDGTNESVVPFARYPVARIVTERLGSPYRRGVLGAEVVLVGVTTGVEVVAIDTTRVVVAVVVGSCPKEIVVVETTFN